MIFRRIVGNSIKGLNNYCKAAMSSDSYVWIDLEMTGLEPEKHTILEIACIVTSPNLDIRNKGINLVIHQSDEVLKSMNDWCIEHHQKTGLTDASRRSKISLAEADTQVADYITQHTNPNGTNYLAGNTVYMDKLFLMKYMPKVNSLLHYRLIDVSCIKTLCSHWYPDKNIIPEKQLAHRALDDIQESINELKQYRSAVFM